MKNSVAIVTGASQGIGRSTAIRLARDFSAVLAARNAEALDEVAAEVKTMGAAAFPLGLDLGQAEAAETVINATLERFGRIDALLNIAGAVPQIDLFEMTDEQWNAGMALKLHGARRLTIRAWDALKQALAPWFSCPGAPLSILSRPSPPLPLPMLQLRLLPKRSRNKVLRMAFR